MSPVWAMGDWTIRFVRLESGQRFTPARSDGAVYIKVITGELSNIELVAYPPVGERCATRLGDEVPFVEAGPGGALFTVFGAGPGVSSPVTSIDRLAFHGPHSEALTWRSFESMYTAATPIFDGVDAHLAPGFHLLDADGGEIAYMFVWAAGKGADLSTHNHGRAPTPTAPAFAEVHWVMHNGTGNGGMYTTPEPGAEHRDRFPLAQGEEHGPYFRFDPSTGVPTLRENGAVEYPWHGWQAGTDEHGGQAYDVVAAFEITVPYARVTAASSS